MCVVVVCPKGDTSQGNDTKAICVFCPHLQSLLVLDCVVWNPATVIISSAR
jgi:hypothetical protein